MNFSLYTKYIGSPVTLGTVKTRYNVLFAVFVVAFCSSMFYAGYWLGQADKLQISGASIFKSEKQQIEELRTKLAENSRDTKEYLGVLMQNLMEMKSHVVRLDSLGKKLIAYAKLEDGEYTFGNAPEPHGPIEVSANLNGIEKYFKEVASLDQYLEQRENSLATISRQISYEKLKHRLLPKGKPVKKTGKHRVRLTSKYGLRKHPLTGKIRFHHGVDYGARPGTPIYAVADGIVSSAEKRAGYGHIVEINHGRYTTRYAHNQKNLVIMGERVKRGQLIALVGKSGKATGHHVHFEVLTEEGKTTDPLWFINQKIIYDESS